MKHVFFTLTALSVTISFLFLSCKKGVDPHDDIDPVQLQGGWIVQKLTENWTVEGLEDGVPVIESGSDTDVVYDSSFFVKITQDSFSFYEHYDNFYHLEKFPYQIFGNLITGDDVFNGYEDEGGGNYESWKTTVLNLNSRFCTIEFSGEYKEIDDSTNWILERESNVLHLFRYPGVIPPASWSDSVVTDNIRRDINPRRKFLKTAD